MYVPDASITTAGVIAKIKDAKIDILPSYFSRKNPYIDNVIRGKKTKCIRLARISSHKIIAIV